MEENKDHYELLEVSKNASLETIKAAYKSMCKKYHPDVSTFDKNTAEAKMKKINEAYEVLSDSSKRRRYDRNSSLEPSINIIRNQQDLKAKAEERERAKERARESARREAELFQKQKSEYHEKKILEFKPKPKNSKLKFVLSPLVFVLLSIFAFGLFNGYEKSKLNDNGIVEKTYSYSESEMLYKEIKNDKASLDSTIQRLNLLNSEISDYKAQYESAGGDSLYKVYKDAVEEYNVLYKQYLKESNDYNKKVERYNSLNGK